MELLHPYQIDIVSAGALGLPEPEETAPDFAGNAAIKALAAATATGMPAFSDNSGFCVAALGGEPGVLSARWAGTDKDFGRAMAMVNERVGDSADPAGMVRSGAVPRVAGRAHRNFVGRVDGAMVWPPRGDKGFGYDPMFVPEGGTARSARWNRSETCCQSSREGVCPGDGVVLRLIVWVSGAERDRSRCWHGIHSA